MSRLIPIQALLSGCAWQRLPHAGWSAAVRVLQKEERHV